MALTGSGRGVLAGSIILFGLSLLAGLRELAVVALAGMLLVAAALVRVLRKPRVQADRTIRPLKAVRGQRVEALLTVTGRGRLRAEELCDGEPVPVPLPPLRDGVPQVSRYELPTDRRGPRVIGPLRLIETDPLGLARHTVTIGTAQTLLVRPRTTAIGAFASGWHQHPDGSAADAAIGGSGSFHSLREFAFGDDTRRIHWPTTARTGLVMVRQSADTTMPSVTVDLDVRLSAYPDGEVFDVAVEAAASIALAATRRGFRACLHLGAEPAIVANGQHRDAAVILDRLAYAELSATATRPGRRKRAELSVLITGPGADVADEPGVLLLRAGDSVAELIGRMAAAR
jgi:uncharacterized protein (DUF58 family)